MDEKQEKKANQAFIQDFTVGGGIGQVKGHVSLEMLMVKT